MRYLLFQLFGLLQAWGSPGAGVVRKTDDHPTKSGVLGLIAACLGIRSDEEEKLLDLQSSVEFSCREDIPGNSMMDFQTIRPDSSVTTFYDNLREGIYPCSKNDNMILTDRYYLTEAFFTICLWETKGKYKLEDIFKALSRPVFQPYLGRKCCPLCLPFGHVIVKANSLKEAFDKFIPDKSLAISEKRFVKTPRVFWEGVDKSIKVQAKHIRRDLLKNRKAWAYSQRTEFEGTLERRARCTIAA